MMTNSSLHSVVVSLRVAENSTLPTTHGHLLHAAFMDMLRLVSPEPAEQMHEANQRKPFTLSPIQGIGHGEQGKISLKAATTCWFRVTFLDDRLLHDFTRYFIEGHTTLRLGRTLFIIDAIHTSPTGHAQAQVSSTHTLWSQWALASLNDNHLDISLEFPYPTAFSFRGHVRNMYVLPDPSLVFSTLAGYWDDLASDCQQSVTQQFVAENVVIAHLNIKSVMLRFPNSPQIGFTGNVTFKIIDETQLNMIRHLNRVADLAFYTGIGSKTPMGMGQVLRQKLKTRGK